MKKRMLSLLLALVMVLTILPTVALAEEDYVAKTVTGGVETFYTTLRDAVWSADEGATVTILKSHSGPSVDTRKPQTVTIDFGGYTFTLDEKSDNNGFMLDMNSNVIMKNGSLKMTENSVCQYLIQDYANLTLEDMQINVGENYNCETALHCRNGVVKITGNTSIACDGTDGKYQEKDGRVFEKKAILIREYFKGQANRSTQVTIDTTGTIRGMVYASYAGGASATSEKSSLTIKNGTIIGELRQKPTLINEKNNWHLIKTPVTVTGGTFRDPVVDEFLSADVKAELTANGTYSYFTSITNALEAGEKTGGTVTDLSAAAGDAVLTIVFDPDNGGQKITLKLKKGEAFALPTFAENGKLANIGWTDKNGFESAAGAEYTPEKDTTLYALWGEPGTVPGGNAAQLPFWLPAAIGSNPFSDVAGGAYYNEAVRWAVKNGIASGTDAKHFSPDAACTRGQAVTFLWRAAGCPAPAPAKNPFVDVKPTDYCYDAVLWAVQTGVAKGTSASTFSPDAACTRGQIVTFLYRAAGSPSGYGNSGYTDVPETSYCAAPVAWAVALRVTSGTSAITFSPDALCTRAQIVTFLYRANA